MHGSLYWRVIITSKLLYDFFSQKDFEEFIRQYPGEFVRGFFDSEGSCSISKGAVQLIARSSKKEALILVHQALKSLEINSYVRGPYRNNNGNNMYWLTVPSGYFQREGRRTNIKKFQDKVGFAIRRKMESLVKATNSSIP